jgi:hypothetical protein
MSPPTVVAWAVCLATISTAVTDYSGKWSGTSPEMGMVYAVLQQDGAKLTGSAGPSETRQLPITTGKADGDHLVFDVKMGGGTMHFDLTASGVELRGTVQLSQGDDHSSASVVLKRVPQ